MDLLIDLGSTNVKYQCGTMQGSAPFPSPIVNDVLFEVDVGKIVDLVKSIVEGANCQRVFISTQMHGYLLCDKDGTPLTNYISWRDKRFSLLNEPFPYELPSNSGTGAKINLPLFGLYAISKLMPEVLGKAKRFFSLGSYLTFALTGNALIHVTDACPTGFYLVDGSQNQRFVDKLAPIVFPRATTKIDVVGYYKGKKIYVALGDQQCSVLGCNLAQNDCLLNTGTATQICKISDEFIVGSYESRPYFDGKTLCTVTGLIGGVDYPNCTSQQIEQNYRQAFQRLPTSSKMIATGGLAEHHQQQFENICLKFVNQYEYRQNSGALVGLKILGERIMNREKGVMLSEIHFSNMPILFKNSGFDFFILDCEHGGFDYSDIAKIITIAKLVGVKSIIRLADNTRKDIIKFMDMGADGLLLQMTNNAQDIAKVVEYAKYAPVGKRGVSTTRAHTLYNPPEVLTYMQQANDRTEIYAQIETIDGVNNIDEILQVEGVTGYLMGPNDLSCEYGCLGDKQAPQILSAMEKVFQSAQKHNKKGGVISANKCYLAKAKQLGMEMYSVGSELNLIMSAGKQVVKQIEE